MAITLSGSTIVIDSGLASGTATGGSSSTLTGTGFGSWAGRIVWLTSGAGAGQSRFIRTATSTTLTVEPNWDTNPASGSTFSIGYSWADIDTALAGVTTSSSNFYLVPYNISLSAGGFIGSINEHVRFTVSIPAITSASNSLWQQGRLFSSGISANGGTVELAYISGGGFSYQSLLGRVRWYRTLITALPVGNGNYVLNNAASGDGLDFRDCYINNIYIVGRNVDRFERCTQNTRPLWPKSAVAPVLIDNSYIENSFIINGDNGAGADNHYFGLSFQGIPQDGIFSKPYWVWSTTTKEGTYFWDGETPSYSTTADATLFYNDPPMPSGAGFHTGKTVAVTTKKADGTALGSVTLGLWDSSGNAAWFEGVDSITGRPVNSLTIQTNSSGIYTNPWPAVSSKSGLVVAERLKQLGTSRNATSTAYGPWTIRERKYGYLEAGGARNFANGATETVILSLDTSITQTNGATVAAYSTLENSAKLYDRYQYFLSLAANIKTDNALSRSGDLIDAGAYNVVIDATAANAFNLTGSTLTIKASIFTGDMTTTGIITLANGAQFLGTRTDANGTIAPPVLQTVTVTNGIAGTLLLIQDMTSPEAPETLYIGKPSSWPYTWTDSSDYVADRDIRVRASYQSTVSAKLFVDELIGTSTYAAPALSYRLNQVDDTVYNTKAIDGEGVAGVTINDALLQIEVGVGLIEWAELYAYEVYWLATEAGILDEGRIITAVDAANYLFEGPWKIRNINTTVPLVIYGGYGRSKIDGTTLSMIDTTGGPIFSNPDQVYTNVVSTAEAVITGDISDVPAAVQSGLSAQGYSVARASKIDNLDVSVSSRLAASGYTAPTTPPTAAQNATAVRSELTTELGRIDVAVSTRLAASGYTAPTTPPTAAQNATAVRSELTTELNRIDTTISSRLAASGYTAPTMAPTSAENATAVRSELATELGRIDSTVSSRLAASGYTVPDNVSIAAIKATTDATLDTTVSSRLAASGYIAPTVPPTASQNATAVRSELTIELARIDAAITTRLAASGYMPEAPAPTSEEVAAAVRTELALELARMDVAVSTRLAASGYTSPDNASIASIKNVTALIPALL